MYEDERIENVPNPKISADFDASLHMIKSTDTIKSHEKLNSVHQDQELQCNHMLKCWNLQILTETLQSAMGSGSSL